MKNVSNWNAMSSMAARFSSTSSFPFFFFRRIVDLLLTFPW